MNDCKTLAAQGNALRASVPIPSLPRGGPAGFRMSDGSGRLRPGPVRGSPRFYGSTLFTIGKRTAGW